MTTVRKEDATMTSQEMLDRNASWTLACDNALLNRLKAFSENLTRNSQEITKECDTLSKDISHLDYKLRNVTNQFLMMSNTQFVENRVEEFKEFSSPVNPTTSAGLKSKSEKEAELMSKMKQAIQLGLKACDRKRQEGDDEESPSQKLIIRKRPYLIGSPKFFSSKYCGLVDESRRVVPWEMTSDTESIHSPTPNSDILQPEMKPNVTFTMPPPSVPVLPVPEYNSNGHGQQNLKNDHDHRHIVPPSPTISDRSSELGKPSSSASVSRENVPRSVTDELNKIYGAFSPPPNADDDSDDDFRPNASAGRIFEDDDDDLFGEKELFPSTQKNTDFFSRSNPFQLPAPPVFSVPPPVNPVPQPESAFSNNSVRTLAGSSPKPTDIPNMSNVADDSSKKDASRNEASLPEVEVGSARSKLPPGAVSMFGGMPPPVFNNDKLQAASATTKTESASSLPSKQNANLIKTKTSNRQGAVARKDGETVSSHQNKQENVNTRKNTSQPAPIPSAAPPKRTDSNSRGSLSSSGDLHRTINKVPPSSLFADDSSDEDIFKSSKKQSQTNLKHPQNDNERIYSPPSQPVNPQFSANISGPPVPTAKSVVQKHQIKKSIFDDSESDDDIFASKSSSSTTVATRKENQKEGKNLFKPATKKLTVPKQAKKSSLFGDDSDSDTDLFGNKKTKIVQNKKPEPKPAPKVAVVVVPAESKMDEEQLEQEQDNSQDDPVEESLHNPAVEVASQQVLNINNNIVNNDDSQQSQLVREKTSEVVKSPSVDLFSNKDEKIEKKGSGSSSRIKKSIFDDSESDDDLFSTKVTVKINKTPKSKSDFSDNHAPQKQASATITVNKNRKSALFGDESDSDNDIFSSKSKKKEVKSVEKEEEYKKDSSDTIDKPPVTAKAVTENEGPLKQGWKDDLAEDLDLFFPKSRADKVPDISDKDDLKDIVKNEPPKSTKVVGNKISEKIKAMQSGKADDPKTDDSSDSAPAPKKSIKSSISVKNLALNLNINPLALKVGAKPPKPGGSNPSTPDKETSDVPSSPSNDNSLSTTDTATTSTSTTDDTATTEDTTTRSTSASPKDELSIEDILYDKIASKDETDDDSKASDIEQSTASSSAFAKTGNGDHFVEIIKARARIQQKRRPPSKRFLKSLATHEEAETAEVKEEAKVNQEETSESEDSNST